MVNYSTDNSGSALDNLAQVNILILTCLECFNQLKSITFHSITFFLIKATDLSRIEASEEEKIKAMMTQSTQDYDPSK